METDRCQSSSPKEINQNHQEWLEASEWDNPLQVAILYKDSRKDVCGHAVQWIPQHLVDSRYCPVCQESISFICNGRPSTAEDDPFVCFKFGKQAYRLSMKKDDSPPISDWRCWLSSFLNKWSFRSSNHNELLAQDRIQTALNLADGYKILHKGKVLFSATFTNTKKSSQQVSDLLMTISAQDESSNSLPSLVVMGTLLGRQLAQRPVEKNTWTWKHLLQFPWAMVYWSIHSTYIFAQTFVAPFLRRSLARDDTNNRGERSSNPDIDDDDDHRHID